MSKLWRSSLHSLAVLALLCGASGTALAQDRFGKNEGLKATEEKQFAQHLFQTGKKLYDEMDYTRAYDNLRRAVELDPTNLDAVNLYYLCGSILGKREDELKASIERIRNEHQVKIQLAQQEMIRYFEAGSRAYDAGDFDEAVRNLDRAGEIIHYFPYQIDQGTPPYRERAEKLIADSKRKRLDADLKKTEDQQKKAMATAEKQEQQVQQEESRRIRMLLDQTSDLIAQHRFKEARDLANKTLELDPHNAFAKKYKEYANQGIHTVRAAETISNRDEEMWQDRTNVMKAKIPQDGSEQVIKFPDDFPERTAMRRTGIAIEQNEDPYWVKNYKKILRERRVTLNFPDVPLQDVILFLQDITGLNFVIAQGVDATEKRISLRLKDIVLENALKIILEQTKLTYIFDRESIIISEPGAASGETYFEIYDISDILYKIPDFTSHRLTLPNPSAPSGGGGGGNSLIFDDPSAKAEGSVSADVLIEIIKASTGGDEAWPSEGTSIEGHRGQLLVTNNREVHAKVAEVLDNLRRNQGLFVHVETRFIDITNDMLEDVGVDFRGLGGNPGRNAAGDERNNPLTGQPRPDTSNPFGDPTDAFSENRGGVDAITRFGGTDAGGARHPATAPYGSRFGGSVPGPNPEPGNDNFVYRTQHIFGSALGGNVLQGARLFGGGGLTLMATQLEFWQLNAIMRAEQESSKVRRLTAPRVTAANRERVFTSVITQRAYISDWQLVSGGTGLTVVEVADPVIATFQEGVTLEVRPTVSSDRKFVTLDVRPSLATLVGGVIKEVRVSLGSVNPAATNVPIQIPEITLEEAFTSVTIPDGGTALLGGFRQVSERNDRSGLPILDSVPIINFFFHRQGELRETRSLVILITANVVSIRDEEGKRFNKK